MKKLMKKIFLLSVTALLILSFVSCDTVKSDRTDIVPKGQFALGITVAADGTLLLDNKPIYVFGTNLYDIFVNHRNGDSTYDVETPFKSLSESGIPLVRLNFGSYAVGTFAQYYYEPDAYFESLDAVVAAAEKYHVGLICSMCWNLSVIWEFCGEYCFSIANKESKTMEVAKQYFTDVVKRYKDSPAVWAWEFGNEYNLAADLCYVGSGDWITSENISIFYKEISTAMREVDPYRLIVGGDSELSCRPASLRNERLWLPDTVDDIVESTEFYAPSPMEAVSSHMYQYGTAGATIEETQFKDFNESISMALEACHRLNKGYYIGEYGPGDFINNGSATVEINKHVLDLEHQAFLKQKVQIALGWLCVNNFVSKESFTDEFYSYWYSEIERLNSDLKADGKQKNIDSYWEKAENAFYTGEGHNFNQCTDHMLGLGNPALTLKIKDNSASGGGWYISASDSTVTLDETTLADGSTGKVFHISNATAKSGCILKNGYLTGLTPEGSYVLKFYMKTENLQGEGLKVMLGVPYFGETSGIKCTTDGEWQLFEIDMGSPSKLKDKYSIGIYFENQQGDVYLYGIQVLDKQ